MARTEQQKGGVGASNATPAQRKKFARSKVFGELIEQATALGVSIPLGVSTADALQMVLDRAVALWYFATEQVDNIDRPPSEDGILSNLPYDEDPLYEVIPNPQGPDIVQPHRYVLMEKEARAEITKLAGMMTQLGIAERVVRVEEAKAALLMAAVRDAAMDAGLDHDQIRALGAALRARVESGLQQRQPAHGTGSAARTVTRQVEELTA